MSRGSKIYKRFGLKLALAYRLRRAKRKILRKTSTQAILMLYGCFNLQRDFKAFGIYRTLRQQNVLITNPKNLQFVLQHYDLILEWLNSKEFKEQYINTNHPYPPLLNPKRLTKESSNPYPNLSYETISPELAWELNLPLPQCDMVKFESHGVGSVYMSFLSKLKIDAIVSESPNAKIDYISFYNTLLKGVRVLVIRDYIKNIESKKLYSLIQAPKLMTLNQVRDPISMLKSYACMKRLNPNMIKRFNLTFNPTSIASSFIRYTLPKKSPQMSEYPTYEALEFYIDCRFLCFHDSQLFEKLINIKENEVKFMDMSEILEEKTLQTMNHFAEIFNVPKIKKEDELFFLEKRSDFINFPPLNLVVCSEDIGKSNCNDKKTLENPSDGINIWIYYANRWLRYEDCLNIQYDKDISDEILDFPQKRIIIAISLKDEIKLKEDKKLYQAAKKYLQDLIQEITNQNEIENNKRFNEKDILDYFRKNHHLRKKFKNVLDEHLAYIKLVRPDIVESWKYYQEFERMCEELDKN